MIEVYDSEVDAIQQVWDLLRSRYQGEFHNYDAFEREARERFAKIGFVISITWNEFAIGGVKQEGAMPTLTVEGRTERHEFDQDRQVHEVTSNILGIPGQEGVIKTDESGVFKKFLEEGGDHGHGHSHGH
jgi:hypothetical protein